MATAHTLPDSFELSCAGFESYPQNLVYKTTCKAVLTAFEDRLNEESLRLFIKEGEVAVVYFRDFGDRTFRRQRIANDSELKEYIKDQSLSDPLETARTGDLAAKPDPKCRFIFINAAGNSRQHLRITRKMMVRILSHHQVMPCYLDFLFPFGLQSLPRDFRFSAFREQTLIKSPARSPAIPGLGRSGRQIQLSFNLKGVSCTLDSKDILEKRWSPRQAAVHHQFDVELGTTLWILTKGDLELKDRIQDLTGSKGRLEDRSFGTVAQCLISSLAVHLLLCHWSCEEWRWYILWLEEVIEYETKHVNLPRGPGEIRYEYKPEDFQNIQLHEDQANEVAMVLEANSYVLESLSEYYKSLIDSSYFEVMGLCREEILSFCSQINNMIQNSKMEIVRAKVLVQIASSRKALVLQHIHSQATEKMEKLTLSMHQVGDLSRKEAIAMRIVTVVTLIYLPATFVSTLFSTDIVKYQDQGSGGTLDTQGKPYVSFSGIALSTWLEVTLPLTFITLGLGYLAFKMADKKRKMILPTYSEDLKGSMV
ncbi:hypothetical protein V495_00927 [Pseudogymnoascus sp. VKM F-4514 (FW-929)]|nr:hypothetical protein V495_00927 [Pseudogymnoascus sp. VKM F-4514 (FW-929)]KFY60415.1 hypothetical protein V497_03648 [Pseudogymnoascus sp. VKM F-4516 (FW-969)]